MSVSRRVAEAASILCVMALAGILLAAASPVAAQQLGASGAGGQMGTSHDTGDSASGCQPSALASPYVPVDSWVYPAVLRLYSLGFTHTVYLGMRPWTRASIEHMLEDTGAQIDEASEGPISDEAKRIYDALVRELQLDMQGPCLTHKGNARIESAYSVARAISGTPLRDSYHLGSTIINDYGRPYENGFNNYSGASGYASMGRFLLYARGEFQGAPSATGYSTGLAQALATIDLTTYTDPVTLLTDYYLPQATIPMGPIATTTQGRFLEAYVSAHLIGHEISFGKQDDWLGPGLGGGMAYSNNAEDIYSFRINRIEPLNIPLLSRLTGPFRYDFLVGQLRGHDLIPNPANPGGSNPSLPNVITPGNPWVHVEQISFRPTQDLEFGFERTVIWGGEGHEPITIKSFLRSFFSFSSPVCDTPVTISNPYPPCAKDDRDDPGARFGAFDFSYRLPFVRKWLTLYADSEVHDDVSPIDAPRRASWRPGLYLSHVPGIAKLDLRVEGVSTAPPVHISDFTHQTNGFPQAGHFMYWETIQKQGYTNQGQLFGDWMGREDKGGQAWITWRLSGDEWIQAGMRDQKATTDFIPGGTTLNDIDFQVVKRLGKDLEVNGNFALEHWQAPIYPSGQPVYPAVLRTVTTTTIQLTWFPKQKVSF